MDSISYRYSLVRSENVICPTSTPPVFENIALYTSITLSFLKYVEEYSNREIAKRLKMNEATVATRARRGKMMLRERLDKEGFYEGL